MASNANTTIWDALSKTDPAHTKAFSRAGGFKGTATKPIWILRRLTEQFGAAGIGWGVNEPKHEYVPVSDGEVLVYCTVSVWHGNKDNLLWGVGGDKAVAKRNDGKLFVDDEAAKKAFTDAVNNAFKAIGVAADVHMGLFDDDKYVAEVGREFAADHSEPVLSEWQQDEIKSLASAANVALTDILKAAKADDLRGVPAALFDGIKRKLNLTLDARVQQKEAA